MAEKRSWKNPNELVSLKKKKRTRPNDAQNREQKVTDESAMQWQRQCHEICTDLKQGVSVVPLPEAIATDWCLKSKIRIVSEQDFTWLNMNKPQHEARALATLQQNNMEEPLVQFHQSRVVWTHPFIPSIDLFPQNVKKTETTRDHWYAAFHSLLQLLQSRYCPYFYVCANSLTMLFISGQVVQPNGVALLTPTTTGFREAMRKQDIVFEMPLLDMGPDTNQESDSANTWLKSMITQEAKISVAHTETLRSQSRSLVSVDGTGFPGLVNFILNNKTVIPNEGNYPILLSPMQFIGAAIQTLKMKRTQAKEAVCNSGELIDQYLLDLAGPIMPHNMQLLGTPLNTMQQQYAIQYHHCEATLSFNQFFQSK